MGEEKKRSCCSCDKTEEEETIIALNRDKQLYLCSKCIFKSRSLLLTSLYMRFLTDLIAMFWNLTNEKTKKTGSKRENLARQLLYSLQTGPNNDAIIMVEEIAKTNEPLSRILPLMKKWSRTKRLRLCWPFNSGLKKTTKEFIQELDALMKMLSPADLNIISKEFNG